MMSDILQCTNCGEYAGSDIASEIERLRDALERVTTDCQLAINVLGNSPAEFDSVRKSFEIVRDRARAALKGQP
jgi:hypothetical protein